MIGKSILHYKILEKLGEGGMGIVYKAEDTKLNREVAIKILPPHLLVSEDDRARFHREAKAAAALNHSNIATVYEINESEEQPFIVMEYIEGATLDKTIEKGPLKVKDAISITIQIADGLGAAHEKKVVHRDIKASNILLGKSNKAKILDFGLAKTSMSTKLTQMGTTIGTVAYMSPEQVQGKEVDHRTDLWSLGILLYEMIAGHLPFKADYDQAIFYSIQNEEPEPLTAIRTGVPMSLEWIVNKLMAKDPAERYQSALDLIIDLKSVDLNDSGFSRVSVLSQTKRPVAKKSYGFIRNGISFWTLVFTALCAGYILSLFLNRGDDSLQVIKASIEMPKNLRYANESGGSSSISPDGRKIVFAVKDSLSRSHLCVRPLNSNDSRILSGTENASYPFWSPDSRSICFFAEGKVKMIDAEGGPVLILADAPFGRGGAWSKKDEIIFAPSVISPNFYGVSSSGGKVRKITAFDSTKQSAPRFPFFLPDGNHFLFSFLNLSGFNTSDIYIGSLDNQDTRLLLEDVSYAQYASGYLIYYRQGVIIAQPFDADSYTLSGNAKPLQANINSWSPRAKADFSVSSNGILLYSGSKSEKGMVDYTWVTDDGQETLIIQIQNFGITAALSPEGSRIAYDVFDFKKAHYDIWIYDVNSKSKMRLTFGEEGGSKPCWSNDGKYIYYNVEADGDKSPIFQKKSDGTGEEELITRVESGKSMQFRPMDTSPDGKFLLICMGNESKSSEIGVVDLDNAKRPVPVKELGIKANNVRFSHDGRWIVYQSHETGASEIYVSSFDGTPGKWQLSANGGSDPLWFKDRIIYYAVSQERYESIKVSIVSGRPVFDLPRPIIPGKSNFFIKDISVDGKRYLCLRPGNAESVESLSLLVNWKGLVEKDNQ